MPPTAPPAPAERFACLVEGLCRAIAARGAASGPALPLLLLVWSRLRRLAARFARLATRLRGGTLPVPASRLRGPASRRAAVPSPHQPRRLPEGFAWLVRLVPQAAASASQLQHLLADPELAAIIAAAPPMGRLLRPLCRMLGVAPPPGLRAAPRAAALPGLTRGRAPPAVSPRAPRFRLHNGAPAPAPLVRFCACGPPVPG